MDLNALRTCTTFGTSRPYVTPYRSDWGRPGGYAAAFYAADFGMKVTLIDNEKNPGGVCLYRGCIPSKALLHVAKLLEESSTRRNGASSSARPRSTSTASRLQEPRRRKADERHRQGLEAPEVNYIQGRASIVDPKTIKVKKGGASRLVNVDYMILALGSLPTKVPSLSINSPRVLDSTGALDLPEIPKSMLVVGGGYIGLELGSVYAALGTKVSVVEMTPGLLPGADRDLVSVLAQRVEKTFDKVVLTTKVATMEATADERQVTFEGEGAPTEATYDYVLVSIGRRPNAQLAGLEKTGVQVDARASSRPTPAAHRRADDLRDRRRGRRADAGAQGVARGARGGRGHRRPQGGLRAARRFPRSCSPIRRSRGRGSPRPRPRSRAARSRSRKFPWRASGRAIAIDRVDGLTKLIIDPETERVLGVGIVGAGAGELIAEGVLAIEMGATAVGRQADDPPASDADRDGDGGGGGVLRHGDARLQAAPQIAVAISAIPPVLHLHTQDQGAGDLFR